MTENREIKSTVFTDLFCDDEKDGKKNFLALYNAIHGLNLKLEETELEIKRINQAIYKTFYNDISMLINGRLIVLIEHQSTLNENIPLRFLEYYVHLLYGIIPHKARYKEKLYKIPSPEFYVFYNGKKKAPDYSGLKLSDAFIDPQDNPLCEVKVKFIDISSEVWKTLPVVKNCDILKQYCRFMDIVFEHQAKLKASPSSEEAQACYEEAIKEAISEGILVDYLTRKSTEVINMFIGEYDYDEDMAVKAEEAREEGLEKGARENALENARNLYINGVSIYIISKSLGMSVEEVREIVKDLSVEKA